MIAEMNRMGPDKCRDDIKRLVCRLLKEVDRRLKVAEDARIAVVELERKLQDARERPCKSGVCKIGVVKIERELASARKACKPVRWRLWLGGKDLPGRKLLLRRMIFRAARLAEKDLRKQKW